MALDTTPGSPGWWLRRLWTKLESERARYDLLNAYYAGNHRLPEGHRRAREAYVRFQRKARTNYTGLVAESLRERLRPIGVRTGSKSTNELDAEAQRQWQANRFDARAGQLLLAAIVHSVSYVFVIPNPDDPTTPIWSIKDPRCTMTETDPAAPDRVRAGFTWWDDEAAGQRRALLVLTVGDGSPNAIYSFTAKIPRTQDTFQVGRFSPVVDDLGDPVTFPNHLGAQNPFVPFVNRPGLDGDGIGEFEDVIDVQDRINSVILDRLVISKMQAYRQRWVKGVTVEDEQGNAQQPFEPGADLIWTVEDPNAAFGDFEATDLTPLLKGVDADVRDLAAITRTPPHYLVGAMVNVSGDALKAAESGLTSKAKDRQVHYGESFERVMRLSFQLSGKSLPVDAETLWGNPEFRTLTELSDAAIKQQAAGVPWQTRMEMLGKTPAEIERMRAQRAEDALLLAQFPQLEPAGTPVRYTAAAIPSDASKTGTPELTSGNANH